MSGVTGKAVVVTGAAKGIGRAVAETLAARGARVVGLDLQAPDWAAASGIAFEACDVTDEDSVEAAFAAAAGRMGQLDALVCNAGVVLEKPLLQTSAAEFDHVVAVNLKGVFLCGKAAVRRFSWTPDDGEAAKPRIVPIASELAHLGRIDYSAYCASKGGVISLTRSWARELAPGVLVNAVAPGPTDTDMLRSESQYDDLKAHGTGIPLARIGRPSDVAGAVAFLLGPDAVHMTGTVLDVNGGVAMY
jgi:3-oxoacyl-[acyl-carrier protein] reductase